MTKEKTKCIAVQLPVNPVSEFDKYKQESGKSKNAILVGFIQDGLKSTKKKEGEN